MSSFKSKLFLYCEDILKFFLEIVLKATFVDCGTDSEFKSVHNVCSTSQYVIFHNHDT
jgi:hypothetical protein